MKCGFQNFHSQGFLYYQSHCLEPHILKDLKDVHQTDDISQGICDSFSYYTFIRHVCCIVYSQRQSLLAFPLDAQSQHSAKHRVDVQQIFVEGLSLTVNHSLCPAFEVGSGDTKLINAFQRKQEATRYFS